MGTCEIGAAVAGIQAVAGMALYCEDPIGAAPIGTNPIGAMWLAVTTPPTGDDIVANGRVDAGPELVPVDE
jgi:hypothetical protein